MTRDLKMMDQIQTQKTKDMSKKELRPLSDPETKTLAEGIRFTFDVIGTPVDPKR